jgi:pilus assembly protein Flp/PilA
MLKLIVSMQNKLAAALPRGDRGATAVEYGLIVALIAVVIIGALIAIGGKLNTTFQNVANNL